MKNERLASTFASAPYETRLLVSLVEAMVGPEKVEKVLTDLEAPGVPQDVLIEGRPLRFYSGLSEAQLDAMGVSDEARQEIYEYFEKPSNPQSKEAEATAPAPSETAEDASSPDASKEVPTEKEASKRR